VRRKRTVIAAAALLLGVYIAITLQQRDSGAPSDSTADRGVPTELSTGPSPDFGAEIEGYSSEQVNGEPENGGSNPGIAIADQDPEYLAYVVNPPVSRFTLERLANRPIPVTQGVPRYPPEAVQLGLSGYVHVEFTISSSGSTENLAILASSSPLFERHGLAAVGSFKYLPMQSDGDSVATKYWNALIVFGDVDADRLPEEDEGRTGGVKVAFPVNR
jgi:TonB family protein